MESDKKQAANFGKDAYTTKPAEYFAGARRDFVSELPANPDARILEVGCSNGNTGGLALAENKCAWYAAVEIQEEAAALAREKLSEVVVGDVEKIVLPWEENSFDGLILSEVLEHFSDPWHVLRKLRPLMKPGAIVLSSSPNVSHYRILKMLWSGDWKLEDFGVMDRTHLRWFTPKTFSELFVSTGYDVECVGPIKPMGRSARMKSAILGGRSHLFIEQIKIRARCP